MGDSFYTHPRECGGCGKVHSLVDEIICDYEISKIKKRSRSNLNLNRITEFLFQWAMIIMVYGVVIFWAGLIIIPLWLKAWSTIENFWGINPLFP